MVVWRFVLEFEALKAMGRMWAWSFVEEDYEKAWMKMGAKHTELDCCYGAQVII